MISHLRWLLNYYTVGTAKDLTDRPPVQQATVSYYTAEERKAA